MKVGFVVTRSDRIGGATIYVWRLAKELQSLGHRVRIIVGGRGFLIDKMRDDGLEVNAIAQLTRTISPVNDLKAVFELYRHISKMELDLISAHSTKAGALSRIVGSLVGTPVLFTIHGWPFAEGVHRRLRWLYQICERVLVPITDHFVAVSDYDRRLGIERLAIGEKKITTVHNGVSDIGPELYADPPAEPPQLIMVARFEPQKDQVSLIRAMASLGKSREWSLRFVGDGALRSKAEKLVQSLNLTDRICFLCERDDVDVLLSESQIFVLSSNFEGFPLTVVEAMRAGLPVVATDVGGVSEAVVDGETGYLVGRRDHKALAEAIRRLIINPGLRSDFGRQARSRYEQYFTSLVMVQKIEELYERVSVDG